MSNCVKNILNKQESIPVGSVPPAWPPPDITLGGTQMNKFEQVSSNHHQMSLEWGAKVGRVPRSDVREAGVGSPLQWDPMHHG